VFTDKLRRFFYAFDAMHALSAQLGDPLEVGGDGFHCPHGKRVTVFPDCAQMREAVAVDSHFQVIGIAATVDDPAADASRTGRQERPQVGNLGFHLDNQEPQVFANAFRDFLHSMVPR